VAILHKLDCALKVHIFQGKLHAFLRYVNYIVGRFQMWSDFEI